MLLLVSKSWLLSECLGVSVHDWQSICESNTKNNLQKECQENWKNKFIHKVWLGNCDKSFFPPTRERHKPDIWTNERPRAVVKIQWAQSRQLHCTTCNCSLLLVKWSVKQAALSQTQTSQTERNEDPPFSLNYSGSGSRRDQEGWGSSRPDQRQLRGGHRGQWVRPGWVLCSVVWTLQR